jgi:hypothetical protein
MHVMIPESELHQELQRFTTRFVDRIGQCAEALQSSTRAEIREEALRKNLRYASSLLEIATGASAAVNLLDMFVFVHLSRKVLEKHWIPSLYGDNARELDLAFTSAEEELTEITLRALGESELARLTTIVDAWIADNPGAIRVEGIRLADFARAAGTAADDRVLQARGLLSGVRIASEATNQAMVIAERSIFLLHRMPSIWRLQVRLLAVDVLNDAITRLRTGRELPRLARLAKRGAAVAVLGAATVGVLWLRSLRRAR